MPITNLRPRVSFLRGLKKRQAPYVEISVPAKLVAKYEADGWSVTTRRATRVRLRKDKDNRTAFADRMWSMLYLMGFPLLSGDGCTVTLEGQNPEGLPLDALAVDDECAIAFKAVSLGSGRSRRPLLDHIAELARTRDLVGQVLRSDDSGVKRKYGAVLLVSDGQPTDEELDQAKDARVSVLDPGGLDYYSKLVAHTGEASRYQFLGEVFTDQDVEGLRLILPAVEARIGKSVAFTFAISPLHLLKIAYVAHRARGELGVFGAYQRMVKKSRLKSIRNFIESGGIFPTNIILNFGNAKGRSAVRFEQTTRPDEIGENVRLGWLHLPARYQSAWIIDGQHRLLAYSGYERADRSFVCVTAFIGMDVAEQAEMFIKINSEQRKVSGNLLTELCADLHWNSPNVDEQVYSIASRAVQELSGRAGSVLYGRIRMSDEEATPTRCISLLSVTAELRKAGFYISKKPAGRPVEYGPAWAGHPDRTLRRTKSIVDGWFEAIQSEAAAIWDAGRAEGGYLAMNDGVVVCLMVLRSLFDYLNGESQRCNRMSDSELVAEITPYGRRIGQYFAAMTTSQLAQVRKRRGNEGLAENSRRVQADLQQFDPQFDPPGLRAWLESRADEQMSEAFQLASSIEEAVQERVIDTLVETFQNDPEGWWQKGVPRDVRIETAKRREEDDGRRGGQEKYLNFIDYRSIIQLNWAGLFEDIFGYGAANGKEKRTSWLVRVNSIRNKVMHNSSGGLMMDELEYLREIHEWLGNGQTG